jgi:hypothetical protein
VTRRLASTFRVASAVFELAMTLAFVVGLAAILPREETDPFRRPCKPRKGRR